MFTLKPFHFSSAFYVRYSEEIFNFHIQLNNCRLRNFHILRLKRIINVCRLKMWLSDGNAKHTFSVSSSNIYKVMRNENIKKIAFCKQGTFSVYFQK